MTYNVWNQSRNAMVNAYLGFASSSCTVVSPFIGKPSILLHYTEQNKLNHNLYTRFSTLLLTPYYFKKKIRDDQVYFNKFTSFIENDIQFFWDNRLNNMMKVCIKCCESIPCLPSSKLRFVVLDKSILLYF
jgi:predicted glycosyltransferase